ncbi:jg13617 [Pararge aegeria aegeria]|uniref:Jg13617 protein n=1 Tax=Pararge aegeria aegeria TaxID=348720 RepID=A0A8S4QTI4_9NEOP|nr:jg13617 [Pararge aegeria aegeria]
MPQTDTHTHTSNLQHPVVFTSRVKTQEIEKKARPWTQEAGSLPTAPIGRPNRQIIINGERQLQCHSQSTHLIPPDVVEQWGSSLSRSPRSPGAVATPQVVIGKCPSENQKNWLSVKSAY